MGHSIMAAPPFPLDPVTGQAITSTTPPQHMSAIQPTMVAPVTTGGHGGSPGKGNGGPSAPIRPTPAGGGPSQPQGPSSGPTGPSGGPSGPPGGGPPGPPHGGPGGGPTGPSGGRSPRFPGGGPPRN